MRVSKIVDLTYPIEEGMLTFHAKWHPPVEITVMGKISEVGRETRKLSFGSHTGTHMDGSRHFIEGGRTIDQIPLETVCGPVSIVDWSNLDSNFEITVEMLKQVNISERMIFKFGWSKYWGSMEDYYYHYPYFSKESAQYLVDQGLKVLGLDTPSPDDSRIRLGSERDSEIHKIFLKNEIVLVEYLANLESVDLNLDWMLMAMPIKIKSGDGAPARVCLISFED